MVEFVLRELEDGPEIEICNRNREREARKEARLMLYISIRGPAPVGGLPLAVRLPLAPTHVSLNCVTCMFPPPPTEEVGNS